jgi:hypothetical protein
MCKLTETSYDQKTFTGYKLVIVDVDGKFYSPSTGIQYKEGPIPVISEVQRDDITLPFVNPFEYPFIFNEKYTGFTSVFANKDDAERVRLALGYDSIKTIEMTLSGNLTYSHFEGPCIAGKFINKINTQF